LPDGFDLVQARAAGWQGQQRECVGDDEGVHAVSACAVAEGGSIGRGGGFPTNAATLRGISARWTFTKARQRAIHDLPDLPQPVARRDARLKVHTAERRNCRPVRSPLDPPPANPAERGDHVP
jgi:hypothetical protein